MASIAEITQSKGWKNFMAKLYGWGASVVITGAMFKIMHWPGAGIMLVLGLSTEAVIFFFSAFEPPHEDPDWSLVYPELAGMHGEEEAKDEQDNRSLTEKLDEMMAEAKIEPEAIERLGAGLRSFGDSATKLNSMSDASAATNEYVENVKAAAEKVGQLSSSYDSASNSVSDGVGKLTDAYSRAVDSLSSLANSADDSHTYAEGIRQVSGTMSELNNIYQKQVSESNAHVEAASKLAESQTAASEQISERIGALMQSLSDSLEDTQRFKEEVSKLSSNLSSLNTVYGNMLTAMNVSPRATESVNNQ